MFRLAMDARPGGPTAKREPSPEGLGINPEDDLSAVGAALNLTPDPYSCAGPIAVSVRGDFRPRNSSADFTIT
jgi:hypothetical protein